MEHDLSPEEARIRYLASRWHETARDTRTRLSSLFDDMTQELPIVDGAAARDAWFSHPTSMPTLPLTESVEASPSVTECPAGPFAVCCNSCEKTIPDSHYHCSTCDDGDFDLCQECVDHGITCYGAEHWLIKRVVKNGQIIKSTTETLAPKPKVREEPKPAPTLAARIVPIISSPVCNIRTCNCCVQGTLDRKPILQGPILTLASEFPENHFLHCTSCDDFDLCKACFAKDAHGHHPKHGFAPAVEGSSMPDHIAVKMSPGRNQIHNAICDGCDKFITGVRHKCLDCPDWDYCADCVVNANFVHPNHRFVPVYDPLSEAGVRSGSRPVHFGICCDGPLCAAGRSSPAYITGIRWKCAVCHDTDFCANCEASPANTHNKTHPLIKFKTPVRHVSVTTTGEHEDGQRMPTMGDRNVRRTSSRSTETTIANISATNVQTVVDVKPEPIPVKEEIVEVTEKEVKEEVVDEKPAPVVTEKPAEQQLSAVYLRDTVTDGTIMPPNHIFEQTWVLRNAGAVSWPAGCSVRFVGGDYMGHVDSNHPAGISDLASASQSTVCYAPLAPGQEFPFTVLLRTPAREGKIISYWRLTTKDGIKFGHRLWCDVNVHTPPKVTEEEEEEQQQQQITEEPKPIVEELKKVPSVTESLKSSQMIFPKLEKESPVASVHEEVKSETSVESHKEADDFEECGEDDEWDASDDGFMTDEEYDILDASDEEYLDEQQQKLLKK
jgi:next to BRCA1 gene 1 protein